MFASGSIKWRLQLWHGALLALVSAALLVAYHRSQRAADVARLDREHRLVLLAVLPELRQARPPGAPPPPPRLRGATDPLADDDALGRLAASGRNPALAAFLADGGVVAHSLPGLPPRLFAGPEDAPWRDWIEIAGVEPGNGFFEHGGHRLVWHVRRAGDVVVLGSPLAPLEARSRALAWRLALGGATVVALGFAAGAWIIARALRPLDDMATAARRIAAGALSERVPTPPGGGELARLAAVLNDSFTRVELAFGQQGRFIADASHELRTPLAVLLNESQLALRRERSAAEYRASLEVCAEAAGRMRRLVDDLLALARADAQAARALRAPCDLAEVARSAATFLASVAEERGVRLEVEAHPAPCVGDPAQLEQIVVNLAMNALRHSPTGETVRLETDKEGEEVVARVVDRGPGIDPSLRPRLFERFQRGDASRSREGGGGAGLGLAISRALAEGHGGRLECESEPGVRTEFTLRLPAA